MIMLRLSRFLGVRSVQRGLGRNVLPSSARLYSNSEDPFASNPPSWNADERKMEPPIPDYVEKQGEPVEVLRARLQYQSRKRGILENGLLLSTFCSRYLKSFTTEQLAMYDRLINKPSNEWDIYYWVTETTPTPAEFDNEVMNLLKEFAKNKDKEARISQPALHNVWQ